VKELPLYDVTAPIACTITSSEVSDRILLVERMREAMTALDRTEDGMLLHFPAGPTLEAQIRQFAVDEKRCCQFWGFEVIAAPDTLTLRWDAPPSAQPLIERLEEFFLGDEPVTSIVGL